MQEKITIGIACYQAADTIERALTSALRQDWPNTEILVVDDASQDAGPDKINAIRAANPHVRFIRHPRNTGPGAVRRTILEHATGTYLAFFDDDDESHPHRLSRQYECLRAYRATHPDAPVVCYASGVRVYPNGYVLDLPAIGSREAVPVGESVADYLLFNRREPEAFYGSGTPTCSLFAPVATLHAVGGFDPDQRRVEDTDLAVRLARAGGHFVGCAEVLFTQYATGGADKSPEANHRAELRVIEKNRDYLERKNRYVYARTWCTVRYHHFRGRKGAMLGTLARCLLRHPAATSRHLAMSAFRRWRHERRMAAKPPPQR
jgi:glycosyltransferase involved in cell wall biosynthesis